MSENATPSKLPAKQTPLSEELAEIQAIINETRIDKALISCRLETVQDAREQLIAAHQLAKAIDALRKALEKPVFKNTIMALQGNGLGFRTDRDEAGGYLWPVVKEAVIEGLLRGVRYVGNEMNIIAKRCYITKDGFRRLVREFPGLTDLRQSFQVPQISQGQAVVQAAATWRLNGVPQSLQADIAIRVNTGMGPDAIIGKANRKLLARVYAQLTGSSTDAIPEGEVDDTPARTNIIVPVQGEVQIDKSTRVAELLRDKAREEAIETPPEPTAKEIPPEPTEEATQAAAPEAPAPEGTEELFR